MSLSKITKEKTFSFLRMETLQSLAENISNLKREFLSTQSSKCKHFHNSQNISKTTKEKPFSFLFT